ncbi:T9SS type A sorting domain-containing protein [Taibaiella chishuiensis]|uniref:Putative secreted protein (Por secretion system target) n=1 Tax=Taibaiella chishuiensis TaxID=1434707 RepID=A0A2P8CYW4_9BACT|nr:T9SS type A sorting domain-containing protein [Taibaiella chishuiensis]PSK90159.1 putative secreted protein (Por secretion system target) [Taibaiella chishuiensis]
MKLKYTLAVGALALTTAAQAQTWIKDTVSMGVGYANSVYYSLANGMSGAPVADNNWHFGVQALNAMADTHGGVGIWTNEATKTGAVVKLYSLHKQGTVSFLTATAADTVGMTGAAKQLHNDTSTYAMGAFNAGATGGSNPSAGINYGWGNYSSNSQGGFPAHSVVGDSLYLLTLNQGGGMGAPATITGTYIVWPRALANGNQWTLYVKNLATNTIDTLGVSIAGATTLFKYYNLTTKTWSDREPNKNSWDIVFSNFMDLYGTYGLQGVTGVLSNYNIKVAQADNVAPNSADYNNFASAYSEDIHTIGSDWKTVNMTTFKYDIKANQSWFVKLSNGDIWQVYFDMFDKDAANNQKIALQKRKVFTAPVTGIVDANQFVSNVVVAPNPVINGQANLLVDAKQTIRDAKIIITDLSGRVVLQTTKTINAGFQQLRLDVSSYTSGLYMVNLAGEGWNSVQKIVVRN